MLKKLITYLIIFSMILSNSIVTFAQSILHNIIIDNTSHNNGTGPNITNSKNVEVLNIVKPTNNGVSHNKFVKFDVGQNGLIINNMNMQQYTPSKKSVLSGEHIEFNRNLGTGNAAKIILNEITGNTISNLKGYTEIYGQKADYILANPNGITCVGCGFINTDRLALVTGKPNIENEVIKDFQLSSSGQIKLDNMEIIGNSAADIVSRVVKIAGIIKSKGNINILTGNDSYNFKNSTIKSNKISGSGVSIDSAALGGIYAGGIRIEATEKGLGVNIENELIADTSKIEITADGNIKLKSGITKDSVKIKSLSGKINHSNGTIYAENLVSIISKKGINLSDIKSKSIKITSDGSITNNGKVISMVGLLLNASKDIINNSEIQNHGNKLEINVGENLINKGKISSINQLYLKADKGITNIDEIKSGIGLYKTNGTINNYGKILSLNALTFDANNDFVNYAFSNILSAGEILFKIGRNIVNYRSNIFAMKDIRFIGKDGIILSNKDKILKLNGNLENIYANPYVSYQKIAEDSNSVDNSDVQYNSSNTLNSSTGIWSGLNYKKVNELANIAGRIESKGNINISADKLINKGIDYNTGNNGYVTETEHLREKADLGAGFMMLWFTKPTEIKYNTFNSHILSGKDLKIDANIILNQSSTLSSNNDLFIKTSYLVNRTSNYVATFNQYWEKVSKDKKWYQIHKKHKTENITTFYQKRIYSNIKSLIKAGNNLVLDAGEGKIVNDQIEDTKGIIPSNITETKINNNIVKIDINLPIGDGLFKRADGNSKYLVDSDKTLLNPDWFAGSDYFFDKVGGNTTNEVKILGDPAYETRLIMDKIREKTGKNYLDNSGNISSDIDQMKKLYDNAVSEKDRLNLTVGIALSDEQVKQLNKDIIWYVEKEIDGKKVLVPELYLAKATSDSIKTDNVGSTISGKNINIKSKNVENSGTIYAKNDLKIYSEKLLNESDNIHQSIIESGKNLEIETKDIINKSGLIKGKTVNIKTENLINESKVYEEGYSENSAMYKHQELGYTAKIEGSDNVNITSKEKIINKGSVIESEKDILLKSKDIIIDVVKLYDEKEDVTYDKKRFSKTEKRIKESKEKSIKSNIKAKGNINIAAEKDIISIGSKIDSEKELLLEGDNVYLLSEIDKEYKSKTEHKRKIDIGSAIAYTAGTVAVAAVTSGTGVGAMAMAVGSGVLGGMQFKKGKITEKETYDEKIVSNEIYGEKVKVKSRKDIVSESTRSNKEIEYEHNGRLEKVEIEEKHIENNKQQKYGGNPGSFISAALIGGVIGGIGYLINSALSYGIDELVDEGKIIPKFGETSKIGDHEYLKFKRSWLTWINDMNDVPGQTWQGVISGKIGKWGFDLSPITGMVIKKHNKYFEKRKR